MINPAFRIEKYTLSKHVLRIFVLPAIYEKNIGILINNYLNRSQQSDIRIKGSGRRKKS